MSNIGDVAQMVERSLRMREVPGSIPGVSKISFYSARLSMIVIPIFIFSLIANNITETIKRDLSGVECGALDF